MAPLFFSFNEARALLKDREILNNTMQAVARVVHQCRIRHPFLKSMQANSLECFVGAVLNYFFLWKHMEDRHTGIRLRESAGSVIYYFEGIILIQAGQKATDGFRTVPEDMSKELLPAVLQFCYLYEAWRQKEPQAHALERCMELVSLYQRLEKTPKPAMERVYRVKCRDLEVMGGREAMTLLGSWLNACSMRKREKRGRQEMEEDHEVANKKQRGIAVLHSMLLDSSAVKQPKHSGVGEMQLLEWELIAMELMLTPTPYCGRLLHMLGSLQQPMRELMQRHGHVNWTFGVDTELIQDLVEAGVWDHWCTNDLVRCLIGNLPDSVRQQTQVRWGEFQRDREPEKCFWVVWLCAGLQFVQNEVEYLKRLWQEEQHSRTLLTLFHDGLQEEMLLFTRSKQQPLKQTRAWLVEGMKAFPMEQLSLVHFHRELVLSTILNPNRIQLPEVMKLDTPHVQEIRAQVQFLGKALAAAHCQLSDPLANKEDVALFKAWLKMQSPPWKSYEFLTPEADAAQETEQVVSLCREFVHQLYLPKQHVLWDLFGENLMLPMFMKILRIIHVNFRVHYWTYAKLISEELRMKPAG